MTEPAGIIVCSDFAIVWIDCLVVENAALNLFRVLERIQTPVNSVPFQLSSTRKGLSICALAYPVDGVWFLSCCCLSSPVALGNGFVLVVRR
jgi:hypothetical protein